MRSAARYRRRRRAGSGGPASRDLLRCTAVADLRPLCLLLLPRPLEGFILRDQAEDLLRADGVVAVDPPRVRYGALARLPPVLGDVLANGVAKRLVKALRRNGDRPKVIVIFHPVQVLLARAILARVDDCELWYGRWDRYEHAYDAGPHLRERLAELHEAAAELSSLTFVASDELARLENEAGRTATLVPLAADTFPAPDPTAPVIAVSLGHLGWRTDWTLLRAVARADAEPRPAARRRLARRRVRRTTPTTPGAARIPASSGSARAPTRRRRG